MLFFFLLPREKVLTSVVAFFFPFFSPLATLLLLQLPLLLLPATLSGILLWLGL